MDSKLTILLLLAAAAQSSPVQNYTSDSCVAATRIRSDLAIIDYGLDISLYGLSKTAEIIYDEITLVLTEDETSSEEDIHPGNRDVRFKLAEKQAFYQLMVGIEPTMNAIKVFQPGTDVAGIVASSAIVVREFIRNIFAAINVTRVARNYAAAQAEIAANTGAVAALGPTLVKGVYKSLFNGTTPVPDAARPLIACVAVKAESHILAAIERIAEQINILLDATFEIGSEDASGRITAAYQKTRSSFATEAIYKYSVIRNLVVAAHLKRSTDIVSGLFDVQSTIPGFAAIQRDAGLEIRV